MNTHQYTFQKTEADRTKMDVVKTTSWYETAHCVSLNMSHVFYRDVDAGLYCIFNPSKAGGGVMELRKQR